MALRELSTVRLMGVAIKDDIRFAALSVKNELIQKELHSLQMSVSHVNDRTAYFLNQDLRIIQRHPAPVTVAGYLLKPKIGKFFFHRFPIPHKVTQMDHRIRFH